MLENKSSNAVVAYNLAGKFVLNGINFFVVSVFTRLLGPENFGLFSLYLTWENILVVIIGLQTQSIIGNISMRYDKNERAQFLSSNIIISVVNSLIFALIILICGNPISSFTGLPIAILLYMVLHSFTNYGVNVVTGVWSFDLEAKRSFYVSLVISLLNIILSLILILCITSDEKKYIGRIVGCSIPIIVFGFWSIIHLYKKGKVVYNREYFHYTLKFSIPIVFHSLSAIVLSQSDRVMLQKMGNLNDVGVYSLMFTLNNILLIMMEAFNTAWVPYFYLDLKNKEYDILKKKSRNYINLYTVIVVGFILVSPEVLQIFAGDEFNFDFSVMPFLSIGSFFVFLYSFPVNYKYYKGETKSIAFGTIAAGLSNIALNFVFIPQYGIGGAAVSTMISYFLLFIFHHLGAKKIGEEYFFTFKCFIPQIIFVLVISYISNDFLLDCVIVRLIIALTLGILLLSQIVGRKQIW